MAEQNLTNPNPNPEAFKTFQTEEDYNKEVKSAESKGKFALLQELGIKSLDEAKTKLSQVATLETELNQTKEKFSKLTEDYSISKAGVIDAYKEEVVVLAKAKVSDKVDFDTALKQVVEKMPFVAGKPFQGKVGNDKSNKTDNEIDIQLSNKYPWLKK